MRKQRNSIEYEVYGDYALFSDAATRIGGEKFSYQVPTYQALKGITESIYWKPTLVWVIDAVRVMNKIRTEGKGIRSILIKPKAKKRNELSYYTYLKDVRYQVLAHFEWNEQRRDLMSDRDENKHCNIAKRAVERGGRRDIFLGTRECQAYVEPCEFGAGAGFYDEYGEWDMGYMAHGFTYPDENPNHDFIVRFWHPIMRNGIIKFERPDSDKLDCRTIRERQPIRNFVIDENMSLEGE